VVGFAAVTAAVAGGAAAIGAGVAHLAPGSMSSVVTAASALAGAGFSDNPTMLIGGSVEDPRKGMSAAGQAALEHIFRKENISLSSGGCYAGPPWPFRRELTPLRITGGPTLRRVGNTNQVELVEGALHIDTVPPPAAYALFTLQTGTAMVANNADYRFFLAPNDDLVGIKTSNTGSGMTEVHILTATSGYKTYSIQTKTALGQTGPTWDFGVGPNRDVFAISKSNTGSGTTELHILSAADNYQKFANQTPTALGPTDASWAFAIAHNSDVVAIKKSGGGTHSTELHILSARHNYQAFVLQTKTALPETDDKWSFDIAHNRDVFAFMKNGTDSGTCELHMLAADNNYQGFSLQTKTAQHEVDNSWDLRVAEDRRVFAIRRSGGASNSTEVHVMNA
jgi:hypothetical protein